MDFVQRISDLESAGPALSQRSAELAVILASEAAGSLNGRLVWVGEDFHNLPIDEIMASDSHMMRRVELD